MVYQARRGKLLDPFWQHFGSRHRIQKCSQTALKNNLIFNAIWDAFWKHFGSQNEAKTGVEIDEKSLDFRHRFWPRFITIFGANIKPKSRPETMKIWMTF